MPLRSGGVPPNGSTTAGTSLAMIGAMFRLTPIIHTAPATVAITGVARVTVAGLGCPIRTEPSDAYDAEFV